jgi:hypothetical protein
MHDGVMGSAIFGRCYEKNIGVWIPSIRLHVELGKKTFSQRDKH